MVQSLYGIKCLKNKLNTLAGNFSRPVDNVTSFQQMHKDLQYSGRGMTHKDLLVLIAKMYSDGQQLVRQDKCKIFSFKYQGAVFVSTLSPRHGIYTITVSILLHYLTCNVF